MESKRQTFPEISKHFCFDSQEYTELGRFLPKSEQIQRIFLTVQSFRKIGQT